MSFGMFLLVSDRGCGWKVSWRFVDDVAWAVVGGVDWWRLIADWGGGWRL